ncbi:MAG: lipoxygenase [Pseudobacteriovorax sp.]|nr:lipoxygenase [Pseudobacteriovorax sp.]
MPLFSKTKLPQFDDDLSTRDRNRAQDSEGFRYNFSVLGELPISAEVPEAAKAGTEWSLKIVASAYKLRRNWEQLIEKQGFVFEKPLPQKSLPELAKMLIDRDLTGILGYCNPDLGVALEKKRPESFSDYAKIFNEIKMPLDEDALENDTRFSDYFVSGLNPVMIENVKGLKSNFGLTDEIVSQRSGFQDETVDSLISDGRLFVVDYKELEVLEPGSHPDQPKFVYAPIVYLGVTADQGELKVLGIQLGQDNDIYPVINGRTGKWDWRVAKLIAKCADINYHENLSHLGLTHLLIDPIIIASFRHLSSNHPLNKLLIPHFEGTIPINALAVRKLLPKGGVVDQTLSATTETAFALIETSRLNYDFRDNFLPKSIERRGVGASSKLTSYPYRDDALKIWNAIGNWVNDYVNLYYKNDDYVAEDFELQSWVSEIIAEDGGRIKNFAPNDQIIDRTTLAETLTMIIFTCSAQHAAVNFPQAEAANASYQPMAGYQAAPTKTHLTEKEALEFLPPLDRAIKQAHTLTLLGTTYYTKLGDYKFGHFDDKRVVPILWKFQKELDGVERSIKKENRTRRTAYKHLQPSLIPQSINI